MKTFLEHIADDIELKSPDEMRDLCFVFPTKRASLYFRSLLADKFSGKVFWGPSILSIEEFINACSTQVPSDEITLVLELFTVYKKHDPEVVLDKFFNWGQILLKDFDEADRYMVNTDKLYRNIREYQELEVLFGDNEETKNAMEAFNKVVQVQDKTQLMAMFIKTWGIISKVQHNFQEHLAKKGLAYQGFLYRKLAEDLKAGRVTPYKQVILCGFNALSASEEVIFDALLINGKGKVYWDTSEFYINDADDAGKFLKRYKKKWKQKESIWINTDVSLEEKQIHIIGTPELVGQGKLAANELEKITSDKINEVRTAIVLGDEKLLFPVLYAFPENIESINVTMGYPLNSTSWYSLAESFVSLWKENQDSKNDYVFNRKELLIFLGNPLIKALYEGKKDRLLEIQEIKRSRLRMSEIQPFLKNKLIETALRSEKSGMSVLQNLQDLLIKISLILTRGEKSMEEEFTYHLVKNLVRLRETLDSNSLNPQPELLLKLIREIMISVRIPFSGEPLKGVQLMGFLETRALDFDNLFVLSLNEGIIPSGKTKTTYIPYAIRKAFKMPTFEELDAIYSYHFKRLLQRGKKIFLFYNTEVAVDGSGEKSRFLRQIKKELKPFENITIHERIISPVISSRKDYPIIKIPKTREILTDMNQFVVNGNEKPRRLSPTTLTTYIECSLRFYFKHVARMPELEEFNEDMDPREFGNIVHNALEKIYKPWEGREINSGEIKGILSGSIISEKVAEAYAENKYSVEKELEGKNLLNRDIIEKVIEKALEQDALEAPIKIISLETDSLNKELELGGRKVYIGGNLDRLDYLPLKNTFRIIDYKTGKVDLLPRTKRQHHNFDEYLEDYFTNSKYKSGFQAYYYAYLFYKSRPGENVTAGIFGLKSVNQGIQYLRNGTTIDPKLLDVYESRLENLISEIFNEEIPFVETDDHKKCEYCSYRSICRKN